ncbi:hypothetical protein CUMW_255510 [Citrus unshiu]|uniref:Uncharacterized protein n=1 Tax=Citrus unshiu TaxID=55188 RepID=A0A2H5QRR0_CITUN|nr:hypothetical protein CUMW_255510 [Citrus unshiu]
MVEVDKIIIEGNTSSIEQEQENNKILKNDLCMQYIASRIDLLEKLINVHVSRFKWQPNLLT